MPSPYEENAIREIHAWKNPPSTRWRKALAAVGKPVDAVSGAVTSLPGVEWVIEKSIGGLISLLNDVSQWSIRPEAVYEEFREKGYPDVRSGDDILRLDLEDIDKVIGALDTKYKGLAAAVGGGTGALGAPGIPLDIAAVVGLNLRQIGEYGTYCGFDMLTQPERLFSMYVLGLASSNSDKAKTAAMANLVKIARDVALKKPWKELERSVFVQIIKQIAKAIGVRLTKQKLAQILPVASALIGAGFDAYYTAKISKACYFLYRERLLAAKYGPDIIELTVAPAAGDEPGDLGPDA